MSDRSEGVDNDEVKLNLKRFKRHKSKIPWSLIRNIFVIVLIISLLFFVKKRIDKKEIYNQGDKKNIDIKVDLD